MFCVSLILNYHLSPRKKNAAQQNLLKKHKNSQKSRSEKFQSSVYVRLLCLAVILFFGWRSFSRPISNDSYRSPDKTPRRAIKAPKRSLKRRRQIRREMSCVNVVVNIYFYFLIFSLFVFYVNPSSLDDCPSHVSRLRLAVLSERNFLRKFSKLNSKLKQV